MEIFNRFTHKSASRIGLRIFLSIFMLLGMTLPFANAVQASNLALIPTIDIVNVSADTSVTVLANQFPANEHFTIRMGPYGNLGLNGIVVATTDSGAGGSFQATYNIPDSLKGLAAIAIRMDNDNGYYYSYNWFVNRADLFSTLNTSGYSYNYNYNTAAAYQVVYTPVPTISITKVTKDTSVVIHGNNFPANVTFTVRMGAFGTLANGGFVVATTDSGGGGSFDATYTIPDSLKGLYQIAIRVDDPTGFYYSYNWFFNNTTAQ